MIQAGDLRDRVVFLVPETVRNTYGEQVTAWREAYKCRARVRFAKGGRALGTGEVWNPMTVAVTARYAPSLGGGKPTSQSGQLTAAGFWQGVPLLVAAGLRMRWKGQDYHVASCNIDGGDGSATLTCSAVELSPSGGGASQP